LKCTQIKHAKTSKGLNTGGHILEGERGKGGQEECNLTNWLYITEIEWYGGAEAHDQREKFRGDTVYAPGEKGEKCCDLG